ncbi:hypothetical protein TNCV_2165881 [Trichonephila clavipes]|nr:hypothetical protein TNCV_2165881 [Trichonephila clavipes]
MYKRKSKTPPKGEKNTKMLAKGERAYSLVDERQRGKRRLRQGEKLNFRCRKARETRPLSAWEHADRTPRGGTWSGIIMHRWSMKLSCFGYW